MAENEEGNEEVTDEATPEDDGNPVPVHPSPSLEEVADEVAEEIGDPREDPDPDE